MQSTGIEAVQRDGCRLPEGADIIHLSQSELLSYRSSPSPRGIQDVTTASALSRIEKQLPSPALRRCAAAPANHRMAPQADKGEDPWNDQTKEKFNRLVVTPPQTSSVPSLSMHRS